MISDGPAETIISLSKTVLLSYAAYFITQKKLVKEHAIFINAARHSCCWVFYVIVYTVNKDPP